MCYRDKTFCESDCINKECVDLLTKQVKADAHKWWGKEDAPIMVADFSKTCPDYIKPKEIK